FHPRAGSAHAADFCRCAGFLDRAFALRCADHRAHAVPRHAALCATLERKSHPPAGPMGFVHAVRRELCADEHDTAAASRGDVLAERAPLQRRMHGAAAREIFRRAEKDKGSTRTRSKMTKPQTNWTRAEILQKVCELAA